MGYKELVFPPNAVFLVTGGAGFIGSNLCEAILDMGYRVRCLDNLSTGKQANVDLFCENPHYTFLRGDIRNFAMFKMHNSKPHHQFTNLSHFICYFSCIYLLF